MTKTSLIGIMADSHGKPVTIAAAVALFKSKACLYMYHLGDICDSGCPETVESCVSILTANNVTAVKGNNDHAISANHPGGKISKETIGYLSALPLVAEYGEALFTHSLPFAEKLGLSCMIRGMGMDEAALFFKEYPGKILFRGHGHSPEIISEESGKTVVRSMSPGENTELAGRLPCIITCGSLAAGYCMIWKPCEKSVKCYSI
ncbi:MAG: metallophosphoesterase family protein [Desulfobacterales bacterium]|nr:metallophosphoesterase family protein [Desulfobacterales bacterium]